jgi:2-oxoglutarate dehydrogenase E2 component (dihydrolipoamide succinyltransferase)
MTIEIRVPELGESVTEATVGQWLKKEGDPVKVGEAVVEIETDKVNLEVGAEHDGVLAHITRQKGDDVKVGDVLGVIDESGAVAQPRASQTAQPAANSQPQPKPIPVLAEAAPATPVARRMAETNAVNLAQVAASGPGGRVTKDDVQRYIVERDTEHGASPTTPPAIRQSAPERNGREERVRMSRRRRTIAQRMIEAQQTAAMLTTFNEIDMTAVMDLRAQRKESFKERHGISLGISSFFVKATIGALKAFPLLNAEIQGDDILVKHYYDIGVAVGAKEGLVVPVLRDADRMSFAEIEEAIKRLAQQANDGTLSLEDLRGGTFTITNGGVFGSLMSTPILNPPQVGILGLHKIQQRPVVLNGQIVARQMMYVALSYDHRIVDGAEAVQFLVRVKELVEDPNALLLEG